MKQILLSALLLALPAAAHAATVSRVDKLSCRGANGLLVESVEGSPYVQTTWMGLQATYQLTDTPVKSGFNYIQIPLGVKDKPTVNMYDIYLVGSVEPGQAVTLDGVIGQTIYGWVAPPVAPAPSPWPLAFRPVTAVRCELVGK